MSGMHPQTGRLWLSAEAERNIGHQSFGHGRVQLATIQRGVHRFEIGARDGGASARLHGRLQRPFQRADKIAKSGETMAGCTLPNMIETHQKLEGMVASQFRRQIV